jgi:hypothetical protein
VYRFNTFSWAIASSPKKAPKKRKPHKMAFTDMLVRDKLIAGFLPAAFSKNHYHL